MRRTQIYLDENLHEELHDLATAEGRSAAAVIREALRAYLASRRSTTTGDDPIGAMIGAFHMPADAATEHDRDLYGAPPSPGRPKRRH